jgi:hypothetical protein
VINTSGEARPLFAALQEAADVLPDVVPTATEADVAPAATVEVTATVEALPFDDATPEITATAEATNG